MKIYPVFLVVILGLKDCQPLQCFHCTVTFKNGQYDEGDHGCEDVTKSSKYLTTCPPDQVCDVIYSTGKGKDFMTNRDCTAFSVVGCMEEDGNKYCVCDEDECNKEGIYHGNGTTAFPPAIQLIVLLASSLTLQHLLI